METKDLIQETYCSFEVAELLKEKWFDEKCRAEYRAKDKLDVTLFHYRNTDINENACTAPTHQMAMKWLREVHGIFICIEFDVPTFTADIYKMNETDEYGCAKYIPPTIANCKTYEEAVEAAIKYVLENLI